MKYYLLLTSLVTAWFVIRDFEEFIGELEGTSILFRTAAIIGHITAFATVWPLLMVEALIYRKGDK